MHRNKRVVGMVYRSALTILALIWYCRSVGYAALVSFIGAAGALFEYAYRPRLRSVRAVTPTPPDSRPRWGLMRTSLRVLGTHWRGISNVIVTVVVIVLMFVAVSKAYNISVSWLGEKKREVVAWIDETNRDFKKQEEDRAAAEQQYRQFLGSFVVEDFEWTTTELSEEAKAQFVNKIQGHKYVVFASFTIRAGPFALHDFVVALDIHPPSDTEVETVTSDIIRESVEPRAAKHFSRVRIGTCVNGDGAAAIRIVSATFAKP